MARDKKQSQWTFWAQYVAARLAAMSLTSFNIEGNLQTAARIGRGMYTLDARHRNRAMYNIQSAFPEWSEQQAAQVTRESFEHFVQLAIEVLHTPREIHHDSWVDHVELKNFEPAMQILNAGRPAILITGHVGNWEVLGYLLATLGYDLDAIARPIDNPLINDWLLGIRERQGMRIITKWDATDHMLNILNNGGLLGFIADQNAGNKGMFVPFFGRLASSYKSIGLLAISQRVPVICGHAHRIGPGFRYELGITDIIEPNEWEGQPDPLYYVTARYARAIEQSVRLRPAQYLWMHRRWKSRPRYERQGKPMPEVVRSKLTQLPWMTDDLLDRLAQPFDPKPANT